ncbi:MAG: electron transport complex subunit RsxG [Sideroxydans sp.]|nr:electron transport complex subunit RsxG [Sideroxydans sp.]
MKRTLAKASLQTALNLLFFTAIGTTVLAFTYNQTRDTIAHSEEQERLQLISQIVPAEISNNDIIHDTLNIAPDPLLGTTDNTLAYRARRDGIATAVVLQAIAPDGYAGKINLILAIRSNGEIAGVRVVSHNETPGLGDYIDVKKSPWIKGFDGLSQARYQDADWKVKKDGGKFDYMAGATITPRAVVKAVHKALQYFAQNRDKLLAPAASTGAQLPQGGIR